MKSMSFIKIKNNTCTFLINVEAITFISIYGKEVIVSLLHDDEKLSFHIEKWSAREIVDEVDILYPEVSHE